MKKLFITASLIFAFSMSSYAQEEVKNEKELTYSADELLKLDSDKEIITLIGNANLKTSVFEFENADKIILNKKTQEIFVIGAYKVNLNGGTITQKPNLEKKWLRYKIGENIAYVE
jgi:lipopolysaccharide assembly outer membrane protein LptD (OstA)